MTQWRDQVGACMDCSLQGDALRSGAWMTMPLDGQHASAWRRWPNVMNNPLPSSFASPQWLAYNFSEVPGLSWFRECLCLSWW